MEKQNLKVYGVDTGSLGNISKELSELDVYFLIESIESKMAQATRQMAIEEAKGNTVTTDLTDLQYALEYLVYQTTKFGVELPEPTVGKHIETTASYNAWREFYEMHFAEMPQDVWQAFEEKYNKGEDVSAFMPIGDWRSLISKSEVK